MADEPEDKIVEDAGGEDEQPGRIAGALVMVILVGVAVLLMKAIVSVAPYVAYFVAGILVTVGVQKARARWGRRDDRQDQADEEAAPPDVGAALRRLVSDDKGVLLTSLRDDLKLPDTKAVKALLKSAGIPWKAGRTREGNGPSVRREAIPPAPTPLAAESHGDGCCCRSGDNSNSNNGHGEGPEEGIRVERTDAGMRIFDLMEAYFAQADKHRHDGDT